jgi:PAS domain S-box-containing protein
MPDWFNRAFDNNERRSHARLRGVTSKPFTGFILALVLIVVVIAGAIEVFTLQNIVEPIQLGIRDSISAQIALMHSSIAAGFAAAIFAIVFAVFSARSLKRSLRQMTAAIQAFSRNEPMNLPANAGGEIGVLVQEFEHLMAGINSRSAAMAGYAERELLYVAAVHSTNLAFLTTDTNGNITGWNLGAERMFGYSANDVIGRNVELLVPVDRRGEIASNRKITQDGERIENVATVWVRKDGKPLHVVIDISPLLTPANGLIGSSAIIRDVSEQRLAEELFGLAVEASPSGMIMIDSRGQIVLANSEIENLFGYKRQELLGRPGKMLLPQESRSGYEALRAEFARGPKGGSIGTTHEMSGLRKDGSIFSAAIELNSIETLDGFLILASVVDVSESRKNERLKDEFVSTVSHELRTPLTSITASLALLSAGKAGKMSESALRLVAIAHSNGQRLVRLINDILDIEKYDSGEMAFAFTQVDARAVVEQAIETSRAYAEEFGVAIRLDADPVIGEMRADADRLMQVISNLLSNAIKFSPRGEEVVVAIMERPDSIRITLRDHGYGIPEEFKPRVFGKFAQADSSDSRQKGGTGLGLNIVKQIVDRLGGEVGFESAPGRGALFFVNIPRWPSSLIDRAKGPAPANQIMLCEDDADVAAMLIGQLADAGVSAQLAATVQEALQRADVGQFAAVLVDLSFPDGDGIDLIQQLRNRPDYKNKPIVVISANAKRGRDDLRSLALDVLEWLDKPVDLERLLEVLGQSAAKDANGDVARPDQTITKEVA